MRFKGSKIKKIVQVVLLDTLIGVSVLTLGHYDEKSTEGSAEALRSFLTEWILDRGGLGVQALVLKGLRLSYLEISLSKSPPISALS